MSRQLHQVDTVAEGLALEAEAFAAEEARVLVWTSRASALVCPAAFRRLPGFAVAVLHSGARGWPVHLRPTGGGAVPQGAGVVNLAVSFTARRDFGIEAGYRFITDVIRTALAPQTHELATGATPHSFCDGAWNLSLQGQKVVGTAQRIRPLPGGSRRVLTHALILAQADVESGARAVNGFHESLGLPPVAACAHTTLSKALGPSGPDAAALACRLSAAASEWLAAPAARRAA